mgnify:CR=1 FL=1
MLVVAFVVLAIAAVGASSSLPPLLQLPDGEAGGPEIMLPTQDPELEIEEGLDEQPELPGMPSIPGWLTDALWAVLLFIAVPTLIWAIWRIIEAQLAIRARTAKTPNIRFTEVGDVVDAEQLAESFADALTSLRQGVDVDEAILGCWRRMESLVAQTGVVRAPTQTSTEFTVDVLAHTSADQDALERLADLYRRAAFSDHELGDAHRDDAVASLETLHASLTAEAR